MIIPQPNNFKPVFASLLLSEASNNFNLDVAFSYLLNLYGIFLIFVGNF